MPPTPTPSHVGAEGRCSFYPREADMLAEYGTRLPTVEINSSFYCMPKPDVLVR
jgi:uncharacterized protein YecE (DUF72 family)